MQIMLTNISWADYIATIALLLTGYYLFVAIRFYSLELLQFFSGKTKLLIRPAASPKANIPEQEDTSNQFQESQPVLFPSPQNYTSSTQETGDRLEQVEELAARLKQTIAEAASKKYIKEEFILSLQLLLKNYSFLKGSQFLVAINDLIASECEKYGFIHLSAEERMLLWNK